MPTCWRPAMAAGTQVGAFHPLVAFADTERAVAALHGATVAIEGDDQLAALLADMAEAIGARPVRLAPGSKAAYHAAAVLAAGGFVALLDAIAELGRVAGLDEAGSLAIYGPLIEGTLGNARALGIRAALTGPITRGDVGTLAVPPRGPARRTPPPSCRCTGPPRTAKSSLRWPVARWHRSAPARCDSAGLARADRTGTIAARWITASPPSTRPARRRISCAHRPGEGAAPGPGRRPARSARPPTRATVLRRPDVAPLVSLRGRWRSIQPAVGARPPTAARVRASPCTGRARATAGRPPPERRVGAVARLRTATATSAGGIVVRHEAGQPWLVVGSRRRERDGRTWTLPKGTPKRGETTEETALREVAEETGLEVRITGPLDSIEYSFVQSGTRIHKTVHYFLMEPTGGDLAAPRSRVRGGPLDPRSPMRPRLLTFETERALVARRRRARGPGPGPRPGS